MRKNYEKSILEMFMHVLQGNALTYKSLGHRPRWYQKTVLQAEGLLYVNQ